MISADKKMYITAINELVKIFVFNTLYRFGLPESKSAIVSQVIAASMEVVLIKPDEKVGASRRIARYLPFWA